MALDVRENQSGRPMRTIGVVMLILAAVGIPVWLLRGPHATTGQTAQNAAVTAPSSAESSARSSQPSPAPPGSADRGGRSRGAGGVAEPRTTSAFALPMARVDEDRTLGARPVASESGAAPQSPSTRVESPSPPVYDATDTSVRAPKLLTPLAYAPLAAGAHVEGVEGAIRIVVNENGTVDSVKATVSPKTIGETMLMTAGLSIAKAWRFDPAVKDGHAVKYSLVIPLSGVFRNSP